MYTTPLIHGLVPMAADLVSYWWCYEVSVHFQFTFKNFRYVIWQRVIYAFICRLAYGVWLLQQIVEDFPRFTINLMYGISP